jgi:hypothetical protein
MSLSAKMFHLFRDPCAVVPRTFDAECPTRRTIRVPISAGLSGLGPSRLPAWHAQCASHDAADCFVSATGATFAGVFQLGTRSCRPIERPSVATDRWPRGQRCGGRTFPLPGGDRLHSELRLVASVDPRNLLRVMEVAAKAAGVECDDVHVPDTLRLCGCLHSGRRRSARPQLHQYHRRHLWTFVRRHGPAAVERLSWAQRRLANPPEPLIGLRNSFTSTPR